tara:strand:- start:3136 stop:3918 length:783 start_codon:yes stop_codon:yes gene_type:complete
MSKGIDDIDNSWFVDEQFDNRGIDNEISQLQFNKPYTFNHRKVNNKADITFIGDSVIDCKAYTGTGKGTVEYFAEYHANPTYMARINDQSVDGFTIYDCIDNVSKVVGNNVVISAGGNDLLAKMNLLTVSDDNNMTMGLMNTELDKLMFAYETMLHQLRKRNRYFLLLTCYDGNLAYNPQRFDGVDNVAHSIVSMWNDRLYRLANDYQNRHDNIGQTFDVLDLRNFMGTTCYYNEIEPNKQGAKRIAKNISKRLQHRGVL